MDLKETWRVCQRMMEPYIGEFYFKDDIWNSSGKKNRRARTNKTVTHQKRNKMQNENSGRLWNSGMVTRILQYTNRVQQVLLATAIAVMKQYSGLTWFSFNREIFGECTQESHPIGSWKWCKGRLRVNISASMQLSCISISGCYRSHNLRLQFHTSSCR